MERSSEFRIVLVTCGSTKEARKIAKAVVTKRLAACVNIVGGSIESIYWWKGKLESARERLLIMKTGARRVKELEQEVLKLHSYETPEILVIRVERALKAYGAWIRNTVI